MNIKKTLIIGIVILLALSCSSIQRNTIEHYLSRGTNHFRNSNYELAIRYYTRAIAIDSTYAPAYFGLAFAHRRLGNHELAIANHTLSIRYSCIIARPEDSIRMRVSYSIRGFLFLHINEYGKAAADFRTASELNSGAREPYYGLVQVYHRLEDWYLSAKYATKLILIDPTYAIAYYFRGVSLVNLNRPKEAIEDFNTAAKLGYSSSALYLFWSLAYLFLDKTDSALQILNKGIELHPNSSMLFFARAELYEYLNYEEKAIADFKRAAELGCEESREILKEEFEIEDW